MPQEAEERRRASSAPLPSRHGQIVLEEEKVSDFEPRAAGAIQILKDGELDATAPLPAKAAEFQQHAFTQEFAAAVGVDDAGKMIALIEEGIRFERDLPLVRKPFFGQLKRIDFQFHLPIGSQFAAG